MGRDFIRIRKMGQANVSAAMISAPITAPLSATSETLPCRTLAAASGRNGWTGVTVPGENRQVTCTGPIGVAAYVGVGLLVAIIGGTIIGRLGMECQIAGFVRNVPVMDTEERLTRSESMAFARDQVLDIIHKVWAYVLIGVGIGAAIHSWVPADTISALLGQDKWWAVPAATLVGSPMYADIFGTLPIAEALLGKGVGVGTVLAFMMAVTALSLPSLIMLKRVDKQPLLASFTGVVTLGILTIGFTFKAITHWFI